MDMIFYIFARHFWKGTCFSTLYQAFLGGYLNFCILQDIFVSSATHLERRTQGTPSISPVIRASEG